MELLKWNFNRENINFSDSLNTSIVEDFKIIYYNLLEGADKDNVGDHDNMQFCPSIAKKLFNF